MRLTLFRPIATISEANCFFVWLCKLLNIFKAGISCLVGKDFESLFTNRSTICSKHLKGPLEFHPILFFETYAAAVSTVAILLRSNKKKIMVIIKAEFEDPVA